MLIRRFALEDASPNHGPRSTAVIERTQAQVTVLGSTRCVVGKYLFSASPPIRVVGFLFLDLLRIADGSWPREFTLG